MILHLAAFHWVDSVSDDDVAALTAALTEMAEAIPVLHSYVAGPNLHLKPGGADYAVAAIVDDASALDEYLDHPRHKEVYDRHLGRMIAQRVAVQLPVAAGSLQT